MSTDTWDIFVTDNGEMVVDMLHGVAALTAHSNFFQLVSVMTSTALMIISIRWAFGKFDWDGGVRWFLMVNMILSALVIPKKPVLVYDYSNPAASLEVIEDVPIGLAAIMSFSTVLSDRLVQIYETAFGTVDGNPGANSFSYSTGSMMNGERVMRSLFSAQPQSPRLIYNVNQFLSNCVFPEATRKKEFETITKSADLIALFEGNTTPSMTGYKPATGAPGFQSCNSVAQVIGDEIEAEANATMNRIGKVHYPHLDMSAAGSKFGIELGFISDRYLGLSQEGPELISQVMSINMIKNSMTGSADSGGEAAIMDFVNAQAEVQSRMTMASIGRLMQEQLPVMHSVLIIVLVALFPFVILFAILPHGGTGVLKNYFLFYLNLQTWPILFAIFARIVEGETIARASAMAKAAAGDGDPQVDMTIVDPLQTLPGETSAIALMMIGLIPGIAMMISKGYSAVASQLESTLRPVNVATENAAAAGATGNISMGNANLQNHSVRTRTEDQVNVSPRVNAGLFHGKTGTGADYMVDRSGHRQIFARSGIGNMVVSGNVSDMITNSVNQRSSQAETLRDTSTKGYTESMGSAKQNMLAGAFAMSEGIAWEDVYGWDLNTSQRETVGETYRDILRYAEDSGLMGADEIRSYLAKNITGRAGISGKIPLLDKIGLELGGGVEAQVSKGTDESESKRFHLAVSEYFGLEGNSQQAEEFQQVMQEVSGNKERLSSSNNSTMTDSLNTSLREAKDYREEQVRAINQISSFDYARNMDESSRYALTEDLDAEAQRIIQESHSWTDAEKIISNRGDNPEYMEVQRQAFEQAFMNRVESGAFTTFTDAEMGIHYTDSNLPGIEGINMDYQQNRSELSAQSYGNEMVLGDRRSELMTSSSMSEKTQEVHDGRAGMKQKVVDNHGVDLDNSDNISEAYDRYTPSGRVEDAARYMEERRDLERSMPEVEKTGPMFSTYMGQEKPSQEQYKAIDPPTSGSIRNELGPARRGAGGQTSGVEIDGKKALEHVQ